MSEPASKIYMAGLRPKGHGIPLFTPEPNENLPLEYRRKGVSIGDVGIWSDDGSFEVLFNACTPPDSSINANGVPQDFETFTTNDWDKSTRSHQHPPGTIISSEKGRKVALTFQGSWPVVAPKTSVAGGSVTIEIQSQECVLLVLPEGASRQRLLTVRKFRSYVRKHARHWYTFAWDRLHPSDSLFVVTGCDKTTAWGIAAVSTTSGAVGASLKFTAIGAADGSVASQYEWQDFGSATVRMSQGDGERYENQCVFIKGFFIPKRVNIFKKAVLSVLAWGNTGNRKAVLAVQVNEEEGNISLDSRAAADQSSDIRVVEVDEEEDSILPLSVGAVKRKQKAGNCDTYIFVQSPPAPLAPPHLIRIAHGRELHQLDVVHPDDTANFLTERERTFMIRRLQGDDQWSASDAIGWLKDGVSCEKFRNRPRSISAHGRRALNRNLFGHFNSESLATTGDGQLYRTRNLGPDTKCILNLKTSWSWVFSRGSQDVVHRAVLRVHLMFADNMIGPNSDNSLYDFAMRLAPTAGVGVVHDWYPTNKYQYNYLQLLNHHKSRLQVLSMQTGECLHSVGSFKQSMFPQSIGIAVSFDRNLAYAVGRAIGAEARSIGIHACFSPVLDFGKEPCWGHFQEAWGEDFVVTSHMGVTYTSSRSKNGSWADPDSPQGCAIYRAHNRQVLLEMLVPFKAVIDLGGAKGVMIMNSTRDTNIIFQGSFPLSLDDTTVELVANYTIPKPLKAAARRVLSLKHDLGLFGNPYIPDSVDSAALTAAHVPLTLDAAHRSIVLLENRDNTLPIKPDAQGIKTIALIGPFSDILNYDDYPGPWGAYPTANSSTLRQAMLAHLAAAAPGTALISSWGANTWYYNGQYNIPGYLLSADGVPGGLRATYDADTNFTHPAFSRQRGAEPRLGAVPARWPAVEQLQRRVGGHPVGTCRCGRRGVDRCRDERQQTTQLFIDGALVAESLATLSGNIVGNVEQLAYDRTNGTGPPPGASPFTFVKGMTHDSGGVPGVELRSGGACAFCPLALVSAVDVAKTADLIVLAVGANCNSDAESGDCATLSLPANQTKLADAMFALGKPVMLIRHQFFPGQSGGQAISDIRFGLFNPGGRVPLSVPYDARVRVASSSRIILQLTIDEQTLPVYKCVPFESGVNYKYPAHAKNYTDIFSLPSYSFGGFNASSTSGVHTFSVGETINFRVTVKHEGPMAESYVPQVYLLVRVSTVTRPLQQLVAFDRVSFDVDESVTIVMPLEVDK
ncbi:hypothetical protein B0H10DRAFT_1957946 [Mycena sp. CBHHK59/15]|nr:hypothetical protein B0H10DRAFT_1957946 [Mycena sp. CBHHK59/15]